MKVNRKSWHYRFINWFHDRKPTRLANAGRLNSCNYASMFFWACVLCALIIVFALVIFLVAIVIPFLGFLGMVGVPINAEVVNLGKSMLMVYGVVIGASCVYFSLRKLVIMFFSRTRKEHGLWGIIKSYADGTVCHKIDVE